MRVRWLFGVLLLATSAPVLGQEVPSLTLEDALRLAGERNPANRRSRAEIDNAGAGMRAAWGAFAPRVTANMQWSGTRNTQVTGTDDFGRTVSLPDPVTFRRSSASQSISASMTLFDGLRNINRVRAARHDVAAADAAVAAQGLQVAADVTVAFFDALRTERLIDVERRLRDAARDRLAANRRLFRVAAVTQVEVLGAEVDVARQDQRLVAARGEARKARLKVLETAGILGETADFRIVGVLPAVFDPSRIVDDSLVSMALDANPSLTELDARVAAAQRLASAARGSRFPTISVSAGYTRTLNEQGFGAFGDLNPRDRGLSFGVTVGWELFSGFQRSQDIANADLVLRQDRETVRETRLRVDQQVRAALIDLRNAYEALQTQRRSTELSARRVVLAREQYRLGASGMTFTNLQQIIESAANEERALVDAQYGFAVALSRVEQLVGEPVGPPA